MRVEKKIAVLSALILTDFVRSACACDKPDPTDCATIELSATYTADLWRNLDGGIERGGAYLDNLDLVADLDGSRWPGLEGVKIHAHVMYNNGREFSGRLVGDTQVISNIEAVDSWRVYELWADYSFGKSSRNSIRFGLYDFNSEFYALDSSALFLNSSHGIGPEIAQTGINGPSIFPVPGLALRLRGQTEDYYWQFAALDGVPGNPDRPERTGFRIDSDEGALLALEIGTDLAGFSKLALGVWAYTADFDSVDELDGNGNPVRGDGNRGIYLLAERPVWSRGESELTGFLRAGTAASRFNPLETFIGVGLSGRGLWPARAEDEFGIALARAANSSRFRRLAASNSAPVTGSETTLELTWRAPVTNWLILQPDIQFVVDPGTDPGLRDAWALGLRFEFTTGWSK